jgi:hypothetical protein
MTKKNISDYIKSNQLDKLINFKQVKGDKRDPFAPETEDLIRLHQLIRQRKSMTVLEFGVGYSTLVIADALEKNKADWSRLKPKPEIRNRYLFKLFSVDASKKWLEYTRKQLPKKLSRLVSFHYSSVSIGTYQDQLCHYYDNLPDVIPDFIYLDAPDPKDVKGKIKGLSFKCDERTVMAGDLLLMESTFLPGTMILIDGRTNNARFLKNNFKRKYKYSWDKIGDVSTFELVEERLGKYNVLGQDFY